MTNILGGIDMKKKLTLVGFIGFGVLFGCSQVSQDVSASLPNGFKIVAKDKIGEGRSTQYVLNHIESGCKYVYIDHWDATAITQMMIEKDGATIPYCEK